MNVISLLTPKAQVAYIYDDCTIRQGLEKLRAHGYTAVPVLARDGRYVGTVSEGDFLWNILDGNDNCVPRKSSPFARSSGLDLIRPFESISRCRSCWIGPFSRVSYRWWMTAVPLSAL